MGLIVIGVIVSVLLITAAGPAIRSLSNVAYNDPSAANYTYYQAAVGAAPWWLYAIPLIVGGVSIVLVLRQPERGSGVF